MWPCEFKFFAPLRPINAAALAYFLFAAALLLCPSSLLAADAAFSLPLQGHYRPGRFMPVHLSAQTDSPAAPLLLKAPGTLSVEIPATNGRIDALIPWLSIQAIGDVTWTIGGVSHSVSLPLHPLDGDERLIGYAGADPDALAATFDGQKLIRVPLDPADPLPGDNRAWEALDGIVLDAASARKLNEDQIRALLAGGAAIALRASTPPQDNWPWKKQGAYWIARVDIAGPTSLYQPDPQQEYAPSQTWLRGWPASLRRAVVLAAVVLVILLTALTLWRSRWMVIAALIICALAAASALVWRSRQSPVIETGGSVVILSDRITQMDTWTYRATLREADDAFPLPPQVRPVFAYRKQADDLNTLQHCATDGKPLSFTYHLKPDQAFAFQSRQLVPSREKLSITPSVNPTIRALAYQLYADPDDRIIGQVVDAGVAESWPAVVIERASATATRP
ncbi:MAG TPA: hypothetical protein VFE47_27070 [Tepidisphaeraceae bacterium]|jgi:hypothetical protein|nr:hypothetical protein [Tepidisphaeraceae bacterium]